jgi:hypothetical protein
MSPKLAMAAALAVTSLAGTARAGEPRGVDWVKALVEIDTLARTANANEKPKPNTNGPIAPLDDPSPQNMGNAWFGVAPRVTLVARDWANSTRLAGDRMSILESYRLSQSTRMVVGRMRLSGARFTPFLQVGVGQWRVDRNYLPHLPQSIEIAGQAGAGFELRVARGWQMAAEMTGTSLIREGQNSTLPQTMLWSAFLASRIEF